MEKAPHSTTVARPLVYIIHIVPTNRVSVRFTRTRAGDDANEAARKQILARQGIARTGPKLASTRASPDRDASLKPMIRTARHATLGALFFFATACAHADPAATSDLDSAGATARNPDGTLISATAPSAAASDAAVELVLQMQNKPPQFDHRLANIASPTQSATRPPDGKPEGSEGSSLLADLKMLFIASDTTTRPQDSRQGESVDGGQAPNAGPSDPGSRSARQPDGEAAPRWSSHPVIRFIRENRVLIVLAVVCIAIALWLTATVSIRRGR